MITLSQDVRIERIELDDNILALIFTDSSRVCEELPLVFVQHGLGSRKERHLDLCLRLARGGFRACTVDARLHGERQTSDSYVLDSDRTSVPFVTAFGPVIVDTVSDISRLATELGAEQYAVVGHSMGGFIALVAALNDKRVTAVVNVAGSLQIGLSAEAKSAFPPEIWDLYATLDPVARASDFWPAAVLLIHGDRDQTVPVQWARDLYAALEPAYVEAPERLGLEIHTDRGHEFTPQEADAAVAWLQRHFRDIG